MNFLDFQNAILDDLSVDSSNTFYNTPMIKRLINRAVRKAAAAYDWPYTERALKRDSESGQEYYNYPENWKPDSIKKLKYNGEKYDKKRFQDYEDYQEEYGTGATDKIFSDYRNRYFINPAPAQDIAGGIEIWGQEIPDDMVDDTDTTPFSAEPEIEEIIIDITRGLILQKNKGSDMARSDKIIKEAMVLLSLVWDKVKKRQTGYKSKNKSMFKRLNLFSNKGTQIGSFRSN